VPRIKLVAAAAAASLVLLASCAKGPTIKSTVGPGSPFCTDMATLANDLVVLNDAAAQSRDELIQTLTPLHAQLVKLEAEAPAADTVNGHSVKEDLGTLVTVYGDLLTELQNASPTDPNAVKDALHTINAKYGQAATDAVNRLDAYANTVCHVSIPTTTTTTPGSSRPSTTSTTSAQVGPTAPSSTSVP
jgi:hypothetical protein